MPRPRNETQVMNGLREKIFDHGHEVVTERNLGWTEQQSLRMERALIVLEMLYRKAIDGDGSLGAAQQYLDRILGKPKENLSLDNAGNPFKDTSDAELISRVTELINTARERGAGQSL